jgi:CBS domain-containing protein
MAATFGASTRATFTAIVFAFELTGDYGAILPLIGAVVLADLVSGALLKHHLMTEKLARRGLRVPRDYVPDVMANLSVADAMSGDPGLARPDDATIPVEASLLDALVELAEENTDHLAVVEDDGSIAGVVTRTDVLKARSRYLELEEVQEGWISKLRRRGRAASRAESRRDPGPGAAPAPY